MENCSNVLYEEDKGSIGIDSCYSSTAHSLSNSPSRLADTETCRTIVSLLLNQRKTNINLEQKLKHLQSSNKTISIDEHQIHSFGKELKKKKIKNLFIFFF
jgi:hypothetical protein